MGCASSREDGVPGRCAVVGHGAQEYRQGSRSIRAGVECTTKALLETRVLLQSVSASMYVREQWNIHGSHDGERSSSPSGGGNTASSLIHRASARTRFPPALSPISTILQGFLTQHLETVGFPRSSTLLLADFWRFHVPFGRNRPLVLRLVSVVTCVEPESVELCWDWGERHPYFCSTCA